MRLMTYNIRCAIDRRKKHRQWPKRLELMADQIQQASIAGFQEVLPNQLDDLKKVMRNHRYVGVGRSLGDHDGEHVPIFYETKRWQKVESGHFWLSATPDIPGSTTWGNRIPRMCTWLRLIDRSSRRGLYVFNTHLDHLSWKSRRLSAQLLLATIQNRPSPGDPVVLMGDFNCRPGSTPLKTLLRDKRQLIDSFSKSSELPNASSTYNGWRPSKKGRRRIDFILLSPSLKLRNSQILCISRGSTVASDHHPVVADLDWA
ncbi:endonuclease/exonuclease/phosphatase family protein [Verrucomicrobiaceae bacterium R5-34]|uniref:Endonuclease/exonuclease/phosphatase family protein n=1 Tax=Oceaniferula flava TaxID=2800421 RepID=A0AAE2VCK9_9BACT|nr:endonuclease/exonuclease/phosphatase family protein [Oceaniferula flavus]MBK1829946.1 endonuclease/exonuclease/phosphatase family protein [Verrucomicrobiaceae bacterium R5-34]MBK1855206.1 endonuclease/exonuclease/phosphatase family protein [Oceaniferula flavus]MBM1136512.1 endonuclease/exonuclease/phosphatase family protein [Oceaniferula flavus]